MEIGGDVAIAGVILLPISLLLQHWCQSFWLLFLRSDENILHATTSPETTGRASTRHCKALSPFLFSNIPDLFSTRTRATRDSVGSVLTRGLTASPTCLSPPNHVLTRVNDAVDMYIICGK
ncbi:hypothetical protein PIB30_016256 [Stylosanthes scabra]|uniref:Secreted protein n=1 Tax=Stylosanthes scabra TaxID=79078 RepID=A0ABU6Y7W7_9FABA|nr:hypothetical protein [Stylosanthes scabra]